MRVTFSGLPGRGRGGEGPDPRPDRAGDDGRSQRLFRRVRGRGHSRAPDGRAHDDLEHVDRMGRAGRPDRPRLDDVRLPRGAPRRPGRRSPSASSAGPATPRTPTRASTPRCCVDASALAPQVTWGTNPGQTVPITGRVPEPRDDGERRALEYMGLAPGTRHGGRLRRLRLHRQLHEQPARRPARGGRDRARRARGGRCARARRAGLDGGQAGRRGGGPRPGVHGGRASSGGTRAARCAWA